VTRTGKTSTGHGIPDKATLDALPGEWRVVLCARDLEPDPCDDSPSEAFWKIGELGPELVRTFADPVPVLWGYPQQIPAGWVTEVRVGHRVNGMTAEPTLQAFVRWLPGERAINVGVNWCMWRGGQQITSLWMRPWKDSM
jgi:hypothetical protein